MELYLLRHGDAGKSMPASSQDIRRGLTASGKEEMEGVGRAIAELGLKFQVVSSSPLERAKESATAVNKAMKRKGEVEEWPELAPDGDRRALYRRLGRIRRDSTVLCVGHEPYLTVLISDIVGKEGEGQGGIRIALKKGGLARLSVTSFTPRATGELRWLLTPKLVRRMA